MKILITLLLFSGSAEAARSLSDIKAKLKPNPSLFEMVLGQNPNTTQTGKRFFVRDKSNGNSFEKKFFEQVKNLTETIMVQKGYEKAKRRKDAHMEIDLELYKNKFVSENKSARYAIAKIREKKDLLIELAPEDQLVQIDIIGWANEFMSTRKPLFHLHIKASDRMMEVGYPSVEDVAFAVSRTTLAPPKADTKMSGPPGCSPRFGFDYDFVNSLGESKKLRIWRVQQNSAAEKAGLKPGDILLAIDKFSYVEGWSPEKQKSVDEILEKRSPVSVTVKRGENTLELPIKALKDCAD